MSAAPAYAPLPPDTLLPTLPRGVWFSAVGETLTQSEIDETRGYVQALGLGEIEVESVASWQDAKRTTGASNWSRAWWQTEHAEERRLFGLAAQRNGNNAVMHRMTEIMEKSADLFLGPAAVASTRAGVADSALARSAAGAASQSLHQFGLTMLTEQSSEHFFAIKFRLFLAGRWPLSINDSIFYIF